METHLYIGKVIIYQAMGLFCYRLFLQKVTFHRFNRFYLLAVLAASYLLPLVQSTEIVYVPIGQLGVSYETLPVTGNSNPAVPTTVAEGINLYLVYLAGLLVALCLFTIKITRLVHGIRRSKMAFKLGHTHVLIADNPRQGTFSFVNYIVLNATDFLKYRDEILRHEMIHVRQNHSLDLLFLNACKIAMWFNPLIYLLERELKTVHEFLADDGADDKIHYAEFLLNYSTSNFSPRVAHSFYTRSQLKSRIVMLVSEKSSKTQLLRYPATFIAIGVLTFIIATLHPKTILIASPGLEFHNKGAGQTAKDSVYRVVEVAPVFPGGHPKFKEYVKKNMQYPEQARRANIGGQVFLHFIVRKNGKIDEVQVMKGMGFGTDKEAIRLMNNSPNWIPAKNKGQVVDAHFTVPIDFIHPDSHKKNQSNKNPSNNTGKPAPLQTYKGEPVYTVIEKQPEFPGGPRAMQQYINTNLKYPGPARRAAVQGIVILTFVVTKEGSIADVRVDKGIGFGADEEAKRILSASPKWVPGRQNGQAVNCLFSVPVTFTLPGSGTPPVTGKHTSQNTFQGEPLYTVFEKHPEFPGGIGAMYKYINKNLKYPAAARHANVEGKVYLSFIVARDGTISDVETIKGLGLGTDEEAERVLAGSPKWTPAIEKGQAVNSRYHISVVFKL